jgi:replication factor C large subunit
LMWVEKYRPKKVVEMVGNEDIRSRFVSWLEGWEQGAKPALLVGPPGTGKTTLVHATAADLGYYVIELNASDLRTKEALQGRMGALGSSSLVDERRLLFLDEVDGLFGRADFGGLEFVVDSIGELALPVAMAANFEDAEQVRKLSKVSVVMRMRHVSERLLEIYVRDILRREGAHLSEEAVAAAVTSARGDVRAAINNAQSAHLSGKEIQPFRNQLVGVAEAIGTAASSPSLEDAVRALRDCDGQPDERLRAAFTTIVAAEIPLERKRAALRALTEANVLMGRIMKTQRWRQLRYLDQLLAGALYGLHAGYAAEDLPWPVKLRIWNDGRYLKSFESYLARRYHVSRADAASFYLHSAVLIFGREPSLLRKVCQEAGLDEKAVNALEREYKLLIKGLGE